MSPHRGGETRLLSGNDAAAEAALRAGMHLYAGYPITPQNEISALLAGEMPKRGRIFIQSESELAAINMVLGAAATGARTMTSSSSPGVSLKQEGISYLAGCRLPAVILNVMRGGPGLGNISGAQGDYYQATRGGGHGDYRTPVLAPWSVQEIAEHIPLAFEIAERHRMPTMVLYDGYLGVLLETVTLPAPVEPPSLDRFEWALSGAADRPPRSLRSLYMGQGELERMVEENEAACAAIARSETRHAHDGPEAPEILLVAFGLAARQAAEAARRLRDGGVEAGLFRPVTLWPFPTEALRTAAGRAKRVLVVEMNTGQMVDDVRLALEGAVPVDLLGRAGGMVPGVSEIVDALAPARA